MFITVSTLIIHFLNWNLRRKGNYLENSLPNTSYKWVVSEAFMYLYYLREKTIPCPLKENPYLEVYVCEYEFGVVKGRFKNNVLLPLSFLLHSLFVYLLNIATGTQRNIPNPDSVGFFVWAAALLGEGGSECKSHFSHSCLSRTREGSRREWTTRREARSEDRKAV